MSDVPPRVALDLPWSVVITALLGQEHPAASDALLRRLAAPSLSAGLLQLTASWYLELAFGLEENHSLVVLIKTLLFLFFQMSVA